MFDPKKPTVLLLGRWQPWHEGHLALFERALAKTGQVVIQVRDVKDSSGGEGQEDNPFSFEQISEDISKKLSKSGKLFAYEHTGYFQPMDTYRENLSLNKLWDDGVAPWKIWK
mgnify:CR=1 FL=1